MTGTQRRCFCAWLQNWMRFVGHPAHGLIYVWQLEDQLHCLVVPAEVYRA